MKVVMARHAGVCFGVERALKMADAAASAAQQPVASLGPLIHNPQAVDALTEKGVRVVKDVAEVDAGTLIIRTHGVPPDRMAEAEAKGLCVVDATCPYVKAAQRFAEKLAEAGLFVIIVGEADHPEVIGIRAHAGEGALVVGSAADLPPVLPGKRVGVVVQTTQSLSVLQEVVDALLPRASELRVHNTICSATAERQDAAAELAPTVDVVVVIGGRNSGNTKRLAEISAALNPRTHLVETAEDLDPAWFRGAGVVGVAAGASTPADQIAGVVSALEALPSDA